MGNMGYCKFENTYSDLSDCLDSLRDKDFSELSESEQRYRNDLVAMCKEIADEFDVEEIFDDNEEDTSEEDKIVIEKSTVIPEVPADINKAGFDEEVKRLFKENGKITAMKYVKDTLGCGLIEAKNYCDQFE